MKNHNSGSVNDNNSTWTLVEQHHYDPAKDADLTTAVVFAVADAIDVSPLEVKSPPMYECVDLATLEAAFFGSDVVGRCQGTGTVEFVYNEFIVGISINGWIRIYEPASNG